MSEKVTIEPVYYVGQKVFHIDGESRGVVTDWRYFARADHIQYYVSWNPDMSSWCDELELSHSQIFN